MQKPVGAAFGHRQELARRVEHPDSRVPRRAWEGALEVGRRVLRGIRNNDLYILTTPEFEQEFKARGEAIVASLPADVHPSEARIAVGRMILGKTVYALERDRRRCERARGGKA